jgi:hypothetical protein
VKKSSYKLIENNFKKAAELKLNKDFTLILNKEIKIKKPFGWYRKKKNNKNHEILLISTLEGILIDCWLR